MNWAPGLGTVLANEEVTSDGRSERGNFPVFKKPLPQWMLRITAYADRLIDDLDKIDWPDKVRVMQRNWIGRSTGAHISFPCWNGTFSDRIDVFTTRPDTLFGATYMVLAPEHPLVEPLTASAWPPGTKPAWQGRTQHLQRQSPRTASSRRRSPSSTARPKASRRLACSSAPMRRIR